MPWPPTSSGLPGSRDENQEGRPDDTVSLEAYSFQDMSKLRSLNCVCLDRRELHYEVVLWYGDAFSPPTHIISDISSNAAYKHGFGVAVQMAVNRISTLPSTQMATCKYYRSQLLRIPYL